MPELTIYNTINRKKEKFVSIHPGFVGMYVCGPTVYGHAHLGHAKSYISFDIISRYLRYLGYKVRYVQNITDVGHLLGETNEGEDRILKQARLERLEPMEVVERYTKSYFDDMDMLNVHRPDISPRASGHILEQIELAETLLQKGYAYEKDGNVYFDVSKFKAYGKLSGRKVDELLEGVRIPKNTAKRNMADFALWKKAEPEHLMRWNSPWGAGYPGWHAECSVMSTKYLGQPFDIHGGGLENVFPHHECEIAQSEAAADRKFANYWIHNNMITVNGAKMGKSLNNFITVKEAVKKYSPLGIRFFVLNSHYRSPLDFSDSALEAGQKGLDKLHQGYFRFIEAEQVDKSKNAELTEKTQRFKEKFLEAMNDDFNTPRALAAVFDYMKIINSFLDKNGKIPKENWNDSNKLFIDLLGSILGILPKTLENTAKQQDANDIEALMKLFIEMRADFRANKNYEAADTLRDKLNEVKIVLKDTPNGTVWEKVK
jgi:cysteinyl-tRNA synthetase